MDVEPKPIDRKRIISPPFFLFLLFIIHSLLRMAVSASSALLSTAGFAGSPTTLLRSLQHIPLASPATATMTLKAVLEPLIEQPVTCTPAAAASANNNNCAAATGSSSSASSSRRGGGGGGTNGHLHPPSSTPLPAVLRSLSLGSDDTLTLNQVSTGVALFHDVNLFWGTPSNSSGGSTTDPTDMRLTLKNPPAKARVTVNGKQTCYGCRLRDKDVLSFTAMDGRTYKYLIRILTEGQEAAAAAAVPPAATTASSSTGVETPGRTPSRKRPAHAEAESSSSTEQPSLAAPSTTPSSSTSEVLPVPPPSPLAAASADLNAAAEEFVCVVCMELQVQSTTLVPCGHSLCHSCVATTIFATITASNGGGHNTPSTSSSTHKVAGSCPTCRAAVRQLVPNRLIDNAVAALVKCPGFFKPDDVAVYQTRTEALHPVNAVSSLSSSTAAVAVDGAATSRTGTRRPTKRARRAAHRTPLLHSVNIGGGGGGASLDSPICIE